MYKNNFFNINSVAIVWASSEQWKIWNILIKNLKNFNWEKYWVNPKTWFYEGIKFFKSIKDLPIIPDILVFAIPSKFVLDSLIEAWEKWVKRVIIISAWFKEIWNIELENKLIEIANKYSIDLLWPNCLWYFDIIKNLNLSFWAYEIESCLWKECWNITMISQSGAMAVALSDWANSKNIWFSKIISMWNKAWIDENHLLKELEYDDSTKVISIYLESIENWEEFFNITKRISKNKPLVLVKSWISNRGALAANSHTWALSSKRVILETAFKWSGIHFTQSLEDFFLISQIFWKTDIKNVPESLAIITNAGWPWVMATDHLEEYNINLAEFSTAEKNILKDWLSDAAWVNNPIDIIWDATSETYKKILDNFLKLKKTRAILLMLTAQSVTDVENIAKVIVDFKIKNKDQFIMVSFMWWESVYQWRKILNNAWILEYDYPRKAIMAYSKLISQKKWQQVKIDEVEDFKLPANIDILKKELKKESKFCSNYLTWEILDSFWIDNKRDILTNSLEEVEDIFSKMNNNILVARISSPDIAHKSDVWGVILNIIWKDKAIEAYNTILENIWKNVPEAHINGVVFSEMIVSKEVRDIFVWFKRDKSFGNILIVWMWWVYVNVLEDVSRRIGIVSKNEIKKMFKELKSYPILEWIRWKKWIDFDKLVDNIFKLQFLFKEFTQIKEIDINPILSDHTQSIIVDAKFYL